MDEFKIIETGGFRISKVHEIFILKDDNCNLYWKKVPSDNKYVEAQIIESEMWKKFKAQEQNKDVLQEV